MLKTGGRVSTSKGKSNGRGGQMKKLLDPSNPASLTIFMVIAAFSLLGFAYGLRRNEKPQKVSYKAELMVSRCYAIWCADDTKLTATYVEDGVTKTTKRRHVQIDNNVAQSVFCFPKSASSWFINNEKNSSASCYVAEILDSRD